MLLCNTEFSDKFTTKFLQSDTESEQPFCQVRLFVLFVYGNGINKGLRLCHTVKPGADPENPERGGRRN